jgi:hypothetical protein
MYLNMHSISQNIQIREEMANCRLSMVFTKREDQQKNTTFPAQKRIEEFKEEGGGVVVTFAKYGPICGLRRRHSRSTF